MMIAADGRWMRFFFVCVVVLVMVEVVPMTAEASGSVSGVTALVNENQSANLTQSIGNVTELSNVFFGLTDAVVSSTVAADSTGRTADDADYFAQPISLATEDLGAVCLDGSPGYLHFSRGSSSTRGWIIHHMGGGWCTSISDCCRRAVTSLGSSLTARDPIQVKGLPLAYLDRANETNPFMKDYNMILLHYCDGSSFSGNLEQPIRGVCKGLGQPTSLYSRGFRILKAAFSYLVRQGIDTAQEVIISGNSAGAKATYLHADWWAEQIATVAPTAKVYGLPDDGMFLDFDRDYSHESHEKTTWEGNVKGRYTQQLQWVYHMMNTSAAIDQSCLRHYLPLGVPWKCMFGQHSLQFITTPMFVMQTMYDSWQMKQILVHEDFEGPVNEWAALTHAAHATLYQTPYRDSLNVSTSASHGAWLTGCYKHCGLWAEIQIDDVNTPEAFEQFKRGEKRFWSQGFPGFPCDACCSRYVDPSSDNAPLATSATSNAVQDAAVVPVGSKNRSSNKALGIGLGVAGGVLFLIIVSYIVTRQRAARKSQDAKEKFKKGIRSVMSKRTLKALQPITIEAEPPPSQERATA